MALAAARRLSSTSTTSSSSPAARRLSEIFRTPKLRSPPPHPSSPFGDRRPKLREPWEGETGALLRRLHEGRYLSGPDYSSEPLAVSPDAVKAAAERFGHDNQVVAKWLSGSDLKKVALFGCPTVERRTVFASKRLRAFFNIQEDKQILEAMLMFQSQPLSQAVEAVYLTSVSRTLGFRGVKTKLKSSYLE